MGSPRLPSRWLDNPILPPDALYLTWPLSFFPAVLQSHNHKRHACDGFYRALANRYSTICLPPSLSPAPKPRQGCLHRVPRCNTSASRNLPNRGGGGGGVYAFLLGSLQPQAARVVNRGSKWMFAPDTGRISVSLRS